jgi:hypothetical protein
MLEMKGKKSAIVEGKAGEMKGKDAFNDDGFSARGRGMT